MLRNCQRRFIVGYVDVFELFILGLMPDSVVILI